MGAALAVAVDVTPPSYCGLCGSSDLCKTSGVVCGGPAGGRTFMNITCRRCGAGYMGPLTGWWPHARLADYAQKLRRRNA